MLQIYEHSTKANSTSSSFYIMAFAIDIPGWAFGCSRIFTDHIPFLSPTNSFKELKRVTTANIITEINTMISL